MFFGIWIHLLAFKLYMFTLFFNGIFRDWTICLARLSVSCCSVPNTFLIFFFFSCFMELELELAGIFPLIAGAMLGFANRGQWRAASLWPRWGLLFLVLVASMLTLRRSRGRSLSGELLPPRRPLTDKIRPTSILAGHVLYTKSSLFSFFNPIVDSFTVLFVSDVQLLFPL